MTKPAEGQTRLTAGTWIGLITTVALSLGGQAFLFHGRVVTLEAQHVASEKRVDVLEIKMDSTRREILDELRALRQEIQKHK